MQAPASAYVRPGLTLGSSEACSGAGSYDGLDGTEELQEERAEGRNGTEDDNEPELDDSPDGEA